MSSIERYTEQHNVINNFDWRGFSGTEADLNKALNGKTVTAYGALDTRILDAGNKTFFLTFGSALSLFLFVVIPIIIVGTGQGGFDTVGIKTIAVFSAVGGAIAIPTLAFSAREGNKLYKIYHKKLSDLEISIHEHNAHDQFKKAFESAKSNAAEHTKKAAESSKLVDGLNTLITPRTTRYGTNILS